MIKITASHDGYKLTFYQHKQETTVVYVKNLRSIHVAIKHYKQAGHMLDMCPVCRSQPYYRRRP